MIIESTLTRQEFIRHGLLGHFRRPAFYLFASLASFITAYGFLNPAMPGLYYIAGWTPLLLYVVGGGIVIVVHGRDAGLPVYLPARYELTESSLELSWSKGRRRFAWSEFRSWRKAVGLYELALNNGQLLLITGRALAPTQVAPFEALLAKRIKPGG